MGAASSKARKYLSVKPEASLATIARARSFLIRSQGAALGMPCYRHADPETMRAVVNERRKSQQRLRQVELDANASGIRERCTVQPDTQPDTATCANEKPRTVKTMRGKYLDSRGGRIRTGDLLLPKQARYRATLRPEQMNLVGRMRRRHRYSVRNLSASSSSLNARPRWPTRSLASSDASPKVSPRSWLMKWLS